MYKRAGIKYSYVVHLRDTGTVRHHSFPSFLSFPFLPYAVLMLYVVRVLVTIEVDPAGR
jgi:hypothetical protein